MVIHWHYVCLVGIPIWPQWCHLYNGHSMTVSYKRDTITWYSINSNQNKCLWPPFLAQWKRQETSSTSKIIQSVRQHWIRWERGRLCGILSPPWLYYCCENWYISDKFHFIFVLTFLGVHKFCKVTNRTTWWWTVTRWEDAIWFRKWVRCLSQTLAVAVVCCSRIKCVTRNTCSIICT